MNTRMKPRRIVCLSAVAIAFLTPGFAQACGGWSARDLKSEDQIVFLVNSISIRSKQRTIDEGIRSDGKKVFFRNGDQAHLVDQSIIYWKRKSPAKREWDKRVIGKFERDQIELENLSPLKIKSDKDGPSAQNEKLIVTNSREEKEVEGLIVPFCKTKGIADSEGVIREKARFVAYLIWKSQKPDLSKGVDHWWW